MQLTALRAAVDRLVRRSLRDRRTRRLITKPLLAESQYLLYFAYGAIGVASLLWHAPRTSSVHRSREKEVHIITPQPACLGEHNASAFQDLSVAHAYRYRPLYPPVVFDLLATLIVDTPRRVLDIGCGTGALARHLVTMVEQVDAVDVSSAMIEQGRQLPNGDHPHLNWTIGRIEDVELVPPYALMTAGESLHWMDWDTLLPRLQPLLTPHAMLVILEIEYDPVPWGEALRALIQRYSTIRDYQRVDLVVALEQRQLFSVVGRRCTEPVPFVQSLAAYVESFHGRASLSRTRMPPEDAEAFDQALRHRVSTVNPDQVELPIVVDITWEGPYAQTATLSKRRIWRWRKKAATESAIAKPCPASGPTRPWSRRPIASAPASLQPLGTAHRQR